ncbi:uncharacterized protein BX663DRAFT_576911 [Cokeromyces recurvatus]|uniref:uncharacterized protein n=1 Tax=Cokeromyces recurvatus TaxID=90255 RepID=UPI00221F4180|nr:uncharacterized protein BX663DRAFT_576911 [Cokeromyces recurvatus]KAI7899591.1 hypothetical protein BX663DRAFT_576911 [Cokeromyces recurvatus]
MNGLKLGQKTDMNYTKNCIFIDESAFDINIKPSTARSTQLEVLLLLLQHLQLKQLVILFLVQSVCLE